MPTTRRAIRFVQALVAGGEASRGSNGEFRVSCPHGRSASLPAADVASLCAAGVLAGDAEACRCGPQTRTWLRRQLAGGEDFAAQHRETLVRADGTVLNLRESPLARLAVPERGQAEPYLEAYQVEAGERLRRLFERAGLQPRLTMGYDPARLAGRSRGAGAEDVSASAADARRALHAALRAMPDECAGTVVDICCFGKGLEDVEGERSWPRRSAKLVLRIGLQQLAVHFGLAAVAEGRAAGRLSAWLDAGARPTLFG